MKLGKHRIQIKYLALALLAASTALSFLSFTPQENFFTVTGIVNYDMKAYPDQLVQVRLTQDGKNFKNFQCDRKGRFETKVYPNHEYIFYFTMDFHATSKVLVDTKIPPEDVGDYIGGLFSFDCPLYELLEGLNLSLLNSPLVKIVYNEDKKDFEYDKKYTEKMMYNLAGFEAQIAELKQRRKDVLKTEAEAKAAEEKIAAMPVEKERKVIEFESEKEKPKAENTRGSRNIMDLLAEGEPEEEEEIVAAKLKEADSLLEQSEAVALDESVVVEEMTAEELELEEAIDESDFISLKVIPKRMEMNAKQEEENQDRDLMDATKMRVQEALGLRRIAEEAKIREEVRSFNTRAYLQREMRLANKKIQNQRVGNLIKTVALAELYYKKEYYSMHANVGQEIGPSVFSRTTTSTWVDKTYVTVMYPNRSVQFRKEEYPFGITYYYQEDKEIDEETYCSMVENLTKSTLTCAK